jgi:hypothetical protein
VFKREETTPRLVKKVSQVFKREAKTGQPIEALPKQQRPVKEQSKQAEQPVKEQTNQPLKQQTKQQQWALNPYARVILAEMAEQERMKAEHEKMLASKYSKDAAFLQDTARAISRQPLPPQQYYPNPRPSQQILHSGLSFNPTNRGRARKRKRPMSLIPEEEEDCHRGPRPTGA